MAPRASKSAALPAALAAAGICAVCWCSLSGAFAVLRVLVPTSVTFLRGGGGNGDWRTTRSVAATLQAEPLPGPDGLQVPSAGSLGMQGAGVLAAVGCALGATLGVQVALRGVVGLAGLYAIMSLNEYAVHRYYQHLGINRTGLFKLLRNRFGLGNLASSGHVEHHAETLDDMSLDRAPHPILDKDPFRGTAFSWSATRMMTVEIALQSYPFLWLCGWSFKASTVALAVAMLLHAAIWQAIHPAMHVLPDPPLSHGVPGRCMAWLRKTPYGRFIHSNHESHHRAPGAHGNYNVCCPGADHLLGTYVGVIPAKDEVELCPAIE